MKNNTTKQALSTVFGVVSRDGILTGVPGHVPGLLKKLTCKTCEVQIVDGLPVEFEASMTSEQKSEFKRLISYTSKKSKRNLQSGVPEAVVENELISE